MYIYNLDKYILILGENSYDIFNYYNRDKLFGLNKNNSAIDGLVNFSPTGGLPFVFINISKCIEVIKTMGLIMHEMTHMSLLLNNWDIANKEEEIITWAEEESYKIYDLINKKIKKYGNFF